MTDPAPPEDLTPSEAPPSTARPIKLTPELERVAQLMDVGDLPLFRPLAAPNEMSPAVALATLAAGVWRSTRTLTRFKMNWDRLEWIDAESGHPTAGKLSIAYATPGGQRLRFASLRVACLVFRNRVSTADTLASILFQALRAALSPCELVVVIAPHTSKGEIQGIAEIKWKDDDEGMDVFSAREELIRAILALEVPGRIERLYAGAEVDKATCTIAAKHLREALVNGAWEHARGTQLDDLLTEYCMAAALAAFTPGGIRLFGLHFDAGDHLRAKVKDAAQLDVEEWLKARQEAPPSKPVEDAGVNASVEAVASWGLPGPEAADEPEEAVLVAQEGTRPFDGFAPYLPSLDDLRGLVKGAGYYPKTRKGAEGPLLKVNDGEAQHLLSFQLHLLGASDATPLAIQILSPEGEVLTDVPSNLPDIAEAFCREWLKGLKEVSR